MIAEIIPDSIGPVLKARVQEISLHGCYLEFIHLLQGSHVLLKISAQGDCVEARANVVYSQQHLGTALGFTSVEAHCAEVLKKWVHDEESPISLQFVDGSVRMYLRNVLCLEAPYAAVAATLESDRQLKRWADYVIKTTSDDTAERFFGKSGLAADGFRLEKDNIWR